MVLLPPVPRVVEPAGATGIEARALCHDAAHIERRQRADGGGRVRRHGRVEAILVVEELVARPREARADAGRPPLEDGPRLVPPEQTLTGAILLAVDSSVALGKTSKTCQDFIGLIDRALGEQLDWSLDDLGFEPSEVEDLRNGVIRPELYNRLRALADKS